MNKTVAVALSGGLDSTVAAAILKRQDYQVFGIHFLTGYEPPRQDLTRPQRVASHIGIPLDVVDCSRLFAREVVGRFVDTYRSGQTPNPCIVCNQRIKFGYLLKQARALGASALATGHYARVERTSNGRFCLLKGADLTKDQSYFLALLTQDQLSRAMFPLGTYTKKQAREMLSTFGLESLVAKESQELCFVRTGSYADFLSAKAGFSSRPGPIVNSAGDILGNHKGLHAYTTGQRRGIGVPGPEPYYVIRLDVKKNRLVIGSKSDLVASQCTVKHINWIGAPAPDEPISVRTRIRYRHKEADSVLAPLDSSTALVRFSKPQYAITPGQAAVFYQDAKVLGGGWIVG